MRSWIFTQRAKVSALRKVGLQRREIEIALLASRRRGSRSSASRRKRVGARQSAAHTNAQRATGRAQQATTCEPRAVAHAISSPRIVPFASRTRRSRSPAAAASRRTDSSAGSCSAVSNARCWPCLKPPPASSTGRFTFECEFALPMQRAVEDHRAVEQRLALLPASRRAR